MSLVEMPHKLNAPGPFYVCDGCCTACDVPSSEAPGMFAYDEQGHCYVKRQPQNKSDLNQMIRVVYSAELECIRYKGEDKDVLRRLAEGGLSHLADMAVSGIKPVARNHVTFDVADPTDKLLSEIALATEFQRHLRAQENEYVTYRFTPMSSNGEKTSFSYAWFEDSFHPVEFSFVGESLSRWLIVSNTSFQIHDWLTSDNRFCDIRWYTQELWNSNHSVKWQETPW